MVKEVNVVRAEVKMLKLNWKRTAIIVVVSVFTVSSLLIYAKFALEATTKTVSAKIRLRQPFSGIPKLGIEPPSKDMFLRHQQFVVKSKQFLKEVLEDKNVAKTTLIKQQQNPLTWLEKNLEVEWSKDSKFLLIALTGAKGKEQAVIVEAVAKSFVKATVERDLQHRKKREAELKEMLNVFLKKKGDIEKDIEETKKSAKKEQNSAKYDDEVTKMIIAWAEQNPGKKVRFKKPMPVHEVSLQLDQLRAEQKQIAEIAEKIEEAIHAEEARSKQPPCAKLIGIEVESGK